MNSLLISHLSPGNLCHTQSVLENKHYGHDVEIHVIEWRDGEKFVDYSLKEKHGN